MNEPIKARDVKDNISMVDLLSGLGYHPVRKIGKEHLYLSMLRDSDTTPSFSVDDKQGTWYDHGEGKGGNIVDFGLLFWKGLSFREVLEKIVFVTNSGHLLNCNTGDVVPKRSKQPKEPNYLVLKIQELGQNHAITHYLKQRGVWLTAQGRLKEIYYYVEDEEKNRKKFFAVGWQNVNGSWEIRSALDHKGCLGHKDVSFLPGNNTRLAVFEGFFDYLSWLTDNPFADDSVLVLNSLSLIQAGIDRAKTFADISTYFDNDKVGRKATLAFRAAVPWAIDCSPVYAGYNDYNDKIVAEANDLGIYR